MVYSFDYIHDYSLRDSDAGEVTPHHLHMGSKNSFHIPRQQVEYRSYYRPHEDYYHSGYKSHDHQGYGNHYHRSLESHYSI